MDSRANIKAFLIAAAVAALDQITKTLALENLSTLLPERIVGDYLRFVLKFNEGAAFSLSWGGPVVLVVLTALAAVAVIVAIFRWHGRTPAETAGLGLVLGGAVGNLIDRLFRGWRVVDFIDMGIGDHRWPTYNVADIAITCGALLMVLMHRDAGRDKNVRS